MAKVKIIVDSASDIPKEFVDKYNITVLPMCINIDDKMYFDGIDLEPRKYLKMLRTLEKIPTTSMVPITMIKEEFEKNLDTYDDQIFVTISSRSSGTYNMANIIKNEIEEEQGAKSNITVIDSMLFTMIYGKIVIDMAKMAAKGVTAKQIVDFFNEEQKVSGAYFIVDDLMHLQKGGRIKPGLAVVGSLLGIKPILTVRDGLVDAVSKERGKNRAIEKITELALSEIKNPKDTTLWVANGDADEDVKAAIDLIKSKAKFKKVVEFDLGSCIATHSGAGLVGLIF